MKKNGERGILQRKAGKRGERGKNDPHKNEPHRAGLEFSTEHSPLRRIFAKEGLLQARKKDLWKTIGQLYVDTLLFPGIDM